MMIKLEKDKHLKRVAPKLDQETDTRPIRMSNQKQSIVSIRPLYLSRDQAAAFLSISDAMLDKLVAQGNAPRPRRLSPGRTAWLVEDLEAWGRSRPVSDAPPPHGSGYGRAGKAAAV